MKNLPFANSDKVKSDLANGEVVVKMHENSNDKFKIVIQHICLSQYIIPIFFSKPRTFSIYPQNRGDAYFYRNNLSHTNATFQLLYCYYIGIRKNKIENWIFWVSCLFGQPGSSAIISFYITEVGNNSNWFLNCQIYFMNSTRLITGNGISSLKCLNS